MVFFPWDYPTDARDCVSAWCPSSWYKKTKATVYPLLFSYLSWSATSPSRLGILTIQLNLFLAGFLLQTKPPGEIYVWIVFFLPHLLIQQELDLMWGDSSRKIGIILHIELFRSGFVVPTQSYNWLAWNGCLLKSLLPIEDGPSFQGSKISIVREQNFHRDPPLSLSTSIDKFCRWLACYLRFNFNHSI